MNQNIKGQDQGMEFFLNASNLTIIHKQELKQATQTICAIDIWRMGV